MISSQEKKPYSLLKIHSSCFSGFRWFWIWPFFFFFFHFTCRFAQVFTSLLSFLVHLTAGRAARRVKAWECAGDVLDFHYWLWHIRQRAQHVLFKGKLCSSACFKCVSKASVKDAIYWVFQKPLSKFLPKVAENQKCLMKLWQHDKVQPGRGWTEILLVCSGGSQVSQGKERLLFKWNVSFWGRSAWSKRGSGRIFWVSTTPWQEGAAGLGGWLGSVLKEQEEMVRY